MIAEEMRRKFSVAVPIFLAADTETIKLERKTYLQPFENDLALRELAALLEPGAEIREEHGLHLVKTTRSEEYLRQHLTYWQRVGRIHLEPTLQKLLEFTQNGAAKAKEKADLHSARRLRYGPHDLHEYRGKFFPQLVHSLINISGIQSDAIVLDPMCGSGTTPCEAIASGHSAISADLNPLSVLITKVKSALPAENPSEFFSATSTYLDRFKFPEIPPSEIWGTDDLRYMGMWFNPVSITDVASIVAEIRAVGQPLYRELFRVCLSNIIRSVSWQKATDLRVRKEMLPYESGTAIKLFMAEALGQVERIHPYLCMLPQDRLRPSLDIREGNSVNIAALFPEYEHKADVLITSPPYATALPYLDTDRLSLVALGLLPRKHHKNAEVDMVGTREVSERERRNAWTAYEVRRAELPRAISAMIDGIADHNHGDGVGFRRRNLPALLGKYFLDMLDAMRSAHKLMKPGANGYYVVGNNSTAVDGTKIEIPTDHFLYEIGAFAGWTCLEKLPMELLVSRDIFRENRGSSETILCFRA